MDAEQFGMEVFVDEKALVYNRPKTITLISFDLISKEESPV